MTIPAAPIGGQADFLQRLKSALPTGWFPPQNTTSANLSPVLDAILSGPAWTNSWAYSLLSYTQNETRIATATDVWLDIIAQDYFGTRIQRYVGETDAAFSARIRANLFAPAATRQAIYNIILALTGNAPVIFEPWNTGDAGGYGGGDAVAWTGVAYNFAGGYGNLQLPFQAFIEVERPIGKGIANVGGYYQGSGWAGGGYNQGAIEYVNPSIISQQVPDAAIYAAIAAAAPAGSIMWVQLVNGPIHSVTGLYLDGNVVALLVPATSGYPTSPTGLPNGAAYSNGGLICVAGTPIVGTTQLYYESVTAASILASGLNGLPSSNVGLDVGRLWLNGGVLSVA